MPHSALTISRLTRPKVSSSLHGSAGIVEDIAPGAIRRISVLGHNYIGAVEAWLRRPRGLNVGAVVGLAGDLSILIVPGALAGGAVRSPCFWI